MLMTKLKISLFAHAATAGAKANPVAVISRLFSLVKGSQRSRVGETSVCGADFQRMGFLDFMQDIIDSMEREGKVRTTENYQATLGSLKKYLEQAGAMPGEFSKDTVQGYEAWLYRNDTARNTVSLHMRILRAVYNRAVIDGLTADRRLFQCVYTGLDKTEKRAVDDDGIRRVKRLPLPKGSAGELARDVFMLSFYLRGMSFIDIDFLRKADINNGMLAYHRRKTGQKLCIKWERCMQSIVDKHPSPCCSPYLLPLINPAEGDEYAQYRNMQRKINRHLKDIGQMARLPVQLTMYVSRHSWASIAKSRNIPIGVISEGMGHTSEKTTRIYLSSFDNSRIDNANRIVIKGL